MTAAGPSSPAGVGPAGSGVAALDLRLAGPALGAWAGASAGLRLGAALVAGLVAVGLGVAAYGWRRRSFAAAALLVCLAAGAVAGALRVAALHAGPVEALARDHAAVQTRLVVTGDPHRFVPTSHGVRRPRGLVAVPVRLERLRARGGQVRIRSPVLVLTVAAGWADLLPGQRVSAAGRLAPARPGQPLAAVLLAPAGPSVVGPPSTVQRVAGRWRAGLREAVARLPPAQRGLVPGLVVGDTSRLPPQVDEDFKTAGLTHLNAVSGANLAIVVGFVLYTARWCGVRGRWLPAAGGAALLWFVVLARPQPSVLRAAVMGVLALLALGTGRSRGGVSALSAAVLGLVLVDPWLARSYGFALSVVATAGLLLLAPGWAGWLHRHRVPLPLAQALAVPAAAQAACAPIIVMISGQVSLVAVPANLLAAPAVAPATVLGVLAAAASEVSAPVARGLGQAAGWPAWWIVAVAERAAAVPWATTRWWSSGWGALGLAAGTAGALLGAYRLARYPARHPARLAAWMVPVVLATVLVAGSRGWPPRGWLLVACDVGQGDALVLSVGAGSAVVVDAGPDPRAVDRCLRRLDVRRVPLVLLTHLHADHVEGLPGVLRHRSVGQVELGPYGEPADELGRVRAWAAAARVPLRQAVVGERVVVGPLEWQVLWPRRVITGEGSVPNNASVVTLAEARGVSMLLTGDVEPAAQRGLLARWPAGPVDVLKVPHHGSAYQAPELLRALRPRVALVSVGAGNDYGHPAPGTLRALVAAGAVVGRTDRDGDLAVVADGDGPRLVPRGVTSGR